MDAKIAAECVPINVRADLAASMRTAEWSYAQAAAVGAVLWERAGSAEGRN